MQQQNVCRLLVWDDVKVVNLNIIISDRETKQCKKISPTLWMQQQQQHLSLYRISLEVSKVTYDDEGEGGDDDIAGNGAGGVYEIVVTLWQICIIQIDFWVIEKI